MRGIFYFLNSSTKYLCRISHFRVNCENSVEKRVLKRCGKKDPPFSKISISVNYYRTKKNEVQKESIF